MTQKTKAANLLKFEAGDRPTDQDFIDLFDSILFLNNESVHDNGLSSNNTTILGDLNIGGNLDIQGSGDIKIEGSFSAGNVSAGVAGGKISAFTSTDSPPFYASSSISEVMFSGISSKTTSSIALTTKGSDELTSGDVRFGIENGKGFLDAQGTTIISYSTGSSATAGGNNLVHMSASVGIGVIPSGASTNKIGLNVVGSDTIGGTNFNNSFLLLGTTTSGIGIDPNEIMSVGNDLVIGTSDAKAVNIKTNNTERIKILSSGKVGIGVIPTSLLHVKGGDIFLEGTSNPTLTIDHTDSGKLIFNIPDGTAKATFTSDNK
jgi:hypothetical protein